WCGASTVAAGTLIFWLGWENSQLVIRLVNTPSLPENDSYIAVGKGLLVESRRRGDIARRPVDHYVGQQFIHTELLRETTILAMFVICIRQRRELPENKGCQTGRAVIECSRNSVRFSRLKMPVATFGKKGGQLV